MKAIVYTAYGPPDVLELRDIAAPVAGEGEVLVRVRAASVNPLDWHFMRGAPYLLRLMGGWPRPKVTRLGVDLAGRVEAVGRGVTQFHPGDEVFGTARGAFAEFVSGPERAFALKPPHLTFEQAAAVPIAAFTALQGLRDRGRIAPGQKVVINGAAGGVGTFAVKIAKAYGAEVTGVCSTRNVELVRSIGASHVIDYTRDDFTRGTERYDLILDCAGNHSFFAYRRVLNRKGICVAVGGPGDRWTGGLAASLATLLMSRFVSQRFVMLLASGNQKDLIALRELLAAGKVTPVIDRTYPLAEVPEAIRYLEQGHARGKVVISVARDFP